MNILTVRFEPTETAQERAEKIIEEMYPLMPITVQEACLEKRGHLDRVFGYNNQDLLWAEALRVTYERVADPVCKQCGCTEQQPCHHAEQGPCWWVQNDLCSHCFMEARGLIKGPIARPWQRPGAAQGTYRFTNPLKK